MKMALGAGAKKKKRSHKIFTETSGRVCGRRRAKYPCELVTLTAL